MTSRRKTASVGPLLQEAVALHQAGRLSEAERLYDKVLAIDPGVADALNLKGLIAAANGRIQEALTLFERAAAARPDFA